MIQFTQEEFEKVKLEGETMYKSISSVYCPYFKSRIYFNVKGLEHLKFITRDKARLPQDQYMRFKLIKLAPLILGSSGTLQGIREIKSFEEVRVHSRSENMLLPISYYEFIAVIKKDRAKIIIKQVNSSELYFWSIIPFWRMNIQTKQRVLHGGNLEID